jgi:hypothetical protein
MKIRRDVENLQTRLSEHFDGKMAEMKTEMKTDLDGKMAKMRTDL